MRTYVVWCPALGQEQEAKPVDDGAMFDWIDARARETFSRHKSGARGQQITAADNPESHLIWAALAWARLHPPKPTAQPQVPEGKSLVPVEPTTDMKQAALKVDIGDDGEIVLTWEEIGRLYRAMLNAAPALEGDAQ